MHHATRRERVGAVGAGAGALDFVVVKGPPIAVEHSGLGPRGREAVRGVPAARVGMGCGRVWGQLVGVEFKSPRVGGGVRQRRYEGMPAADERVER